ncbi:DAK2 domain-containing protein [Necropsobacter rosorum]|uniref:dihydroxyacetone kinase family protein n=1 Tax=Necropsobacter rosorum TaxID=908285 RepID=UPI000509DDAC
MEKITIEQLPQLFEAIADQFAKNADILCQMDSRMGDGDLGLTMKKGFGGLPAIFRRINETDLAKKIQYAGIELTDLVPSTMGMLMGTGISYAGKALSGKTELDAQSIPLFLHGFCEGIIKRGKCHRGDRTVLDSLGQAADESKKYISEKLGASLKEVCLAALEGAKKGVEATKTMKPKFGKAAVYANIAEGIADQGAVAGLVMIQGITDYVLMN